MADYESEIGLSHGRLPSTLLIQERSGSAVAHQRPAQFSRASLNYNYSRGVEGRPEAQIA